MARSMPSSSSTPILVATGAVDAAPGLAGRGGEGARLLEGGLQRGSVGGDQALYLIGVGLTGVDEPLGVEVPDRTPSVDQPVHLRLGVAGLVPLVVAQPAVAHQVDDHVLVERLAEGQGDPRHPQHGFGVVAVDMEDRRLHPLGDIRGVEAGTGIDGGGGEPDLVVDHDVDGPAGRVAAELGEVEGLGDDALTGEGGVSMEEQREDQVVAARPELVLTGPGDALEHRVDRLQVAGVGRHLDAEPPAVRGGVLATGAQVVLDVTGEVAGVVGLLVADELVEDGGEVLLGGVGQHVQPAPVRHAEHDLFHPGVGGGVEHHVEQRDEALGALQAEALGAEELGVEEPLEALRLDQLGEQPALLVAADRRRRSLDVLLDPQLLVGLLDVHVLDTRRSAVGVAQHAEDLAQRHPGAAGQPSGGELTVEVPQAEPVGDRVELVVDLRRLLAQRVEVGDEMAPHPVHVDELEDAGLLLGPPLAPRRRVGVDRPLDRDVRDRHRGEDVLVEPVGAEQQLRGPAPGTSRSPHPG